MSKYTEEFRRNAIELMKKVGITQATKELKVAHCTIYRWCRELEGMTPSDQEEIDSTDVDKLIEDQEKGEHPSEPSHREQMDAQDEALEDEEPDTIAMAMALLVIENTHLREVIHHLRDTISGLTDHNLL